MVRFINLFLLDLRTILVDTFFFSTNYTFTLRQHSLLFFIKRQARILNDRRRYIIKKYVYTINHKRIALNYFFFSM
jgi:hypothetical protein